MKTRYWLLPALLLAITCKLNGQDAHYWSAGYGPAGFFMPGSVIAQNGDSGVLFYNPALLVNTGNTTSSLTGTIYQWRSITMKNGIGTGLHLNSAGTSIVPMVASHAVPYFKNKLPFTLAYAIVHTPVMDYGVSQQRDVVENVLDDTYSPGREVFIGQYKSANRTDVTAFQLSAGMRASRRLSVGLTMEGMLRKQNYTFDYVSRALMNPAGPDTVLAPITTVSEDYTVSYHQIGFRAKAGLAWEISPSHHVGLLLTTPVWKLYGSGSLISNLEINNLAYLPGVNINILASTRQSRLKPNWKNPLSIAAGYTYMHKRGQLYVCAEYFAPVKAYKAMVPKDAPFMRPDTGKNLLSTSYLQLLDGRRGVLNVGIGGSYHLFGGTTLFASLRTDFSYDRGDSRTITEGHNINTTTWDLYHAQVGLSTRHKRYHVRAGLLLSYGGTKHYEQTMNLDHPDESNFLIGDPQTTPARTLQAGLLVSYIHNF